MNLSAKAHMKNTCRVLANFEETIILYIYYYVTCILKVYSICRMLVVYKVCLQYACKM